MITKVPFISIVAMNTETLLTNNKMSIKYK